MGTEHAGSFIFAHLRKMLLERSVNNSQEIAFVESLKLWGLQEYIDTSKNFCRRAYFEGIYIYYN